MKIIKLFSISISCILFIVLLFHYNIYSTSWGLLTFAAFIGLILLIFDQLDYYLVLFFRLSSWVNPILKLSIILVKLDGVENISETKRIIKYLDEEFEPNMAKIKLKYYKNQLTIKPSLILVCNHIRENNTSFDKVRILQHLIRLALSDRLLSDREMEFLEQVTKRIGLPERTLNALLQLHIYVTEEDIRNQKINKTYVNSSSKKAYSILGLESNATMDEVKDAHRELVKIYHPDKLKKNERNKEQAKIKFQAITDAYQFLKSELN